MKITRRTVLTGGTAFAAVGFDPLIGRQEDTPTAAPSGVAPVELTVNAKTTTLSLDNRVTVLDDKHEPLRTAVMRTGHRLEAYVENIPEGLPSTAIADMSKGKPAMSRGTGRKDVAAYAFGAHFVEVRVHSRTREIRVARVVSAFAAGTIVNPTAAHSQFMGGAIWGLSSALFEATELDPRTARYVNRNLADYLVPVNADVPSIEIIMVPEKDERVNPLGVKGIGEIGIVGMNAAVANAVFHATGRRIRELPIRAEKLL
ncbi:MAG TPA: molybdopterin cofactor-binding domain-containing protein [Steroidobacteraceae bacterium]|jgi:xanthine dehydrogenase YagR molybdenum-binding subunit|nr:molybdopterin cofactor-binding domain-containing protein [Steroidobacteraceae bacterium]